MRSLAYLVAASLTVVVLLALSLAIPTREANAAAPWFIVVEGDLLTTPVILDDWDENQALLLSDGPPLTEAERADRPSLALRPLWGPEWEHHPRDVASVRGLASVAAPVQGRFYPAIGERPAVLTLHGAVHREGSAALNALERRGVPMRVETAPANGATLDVEVATQGALLLAIAALVVVTRTATEQSSMRTSV